ncbi:MAG: PilT/PilU family type 4a pilus ATPase [Lachnospiraceae bacterium]|nr:PilT/PilU family type 4a pilus ATPase [Lachnospiraceae bacterium]
MDTAAYLKGAIEKKASDIFFVVGQPVSYKIGGQLERQGAENLQKGDTEEIVRTLYQMADNRDLKNGIDGDDDFALSIPGVGRFRANIFRQRGTWSAVLRSVSFDLPDIASMNIPDAVVGLSDQHKGLILVTGTAGSGKSTTLSYIIDQINQKRNCHILTLEDPIEFLHKHKKSIVSQREISIDTVDYHTALRAALREAPDVILIGEMRDLATIEIAMTAAETGHLVLSTLHTVGAANTIDRVIDVFPANQQQQIRVQLSMVLNAIVSQQLLPAVGGGLVPAFEILEANSAIRTMIRDGKVHQIDSVIYASAKDGMKSMDASILELYKAGRIDAGTAMAHCMNQDAMKRNVRL